MENRGLAANENRQYFSTVKGIAISALLFVHTGLFQPCGGGAALQLCNWITSFYMPIFFVLYGWGASDQTLTLKEYIHYAKKKFLRLLIPYYCWALFYTPISMMSANDTTSCFDLTSCLYLVAKESHTSLGRAQSNQTLWFLPVMFACQMIFKALQSINARVPNKGKFTLYILWLAECIALVIVSKKLEIMNAARFNLPFTLHVAIISVVFMVFGKAAKSLFDHITFRKTVSRKALSSLIPLGGVLLILIGSMGNYFNGVYRDSFATIVTVNAEYGNSVILYLFNGSIISLGIILVCYVMPNIRPITYMGDNSLLLMASHQITFIYSLAFTRWLEVKIGYPFSNGMIMLLLNTISCGMVTYPIALIVNRYFPQLNKGISIQSLRP